MDRHRQLCRFLVAAAAVCLTSISIAETTTAAAPEPRELRFTVLGDNRTDNNPNLPFDAIVSAMQADHPAFALHTGDVIYADSVATAPEMQGLWDSFRKSTAGFTAPIHFAPGNHDIFNPVSARVWQEKAGKTYQTFDQAGCRFIALDTDSLPGHLDDAQFAFLDQQLQSAGDKRVFVFMHDPPFPSGPWLRQALDAKDANRLHETLLHHKQNVAAVFCGHEHLFGFVQKDAIPYYITGGANPTLYTPPDLGGFHHYLLVHVRNNETKVEIRPVTPSGKLPVASRVVAAGEILDDFERPISTWLTWDNTVGASVIDPPERPANGGREALGIDVDPKLCQYPVVYTLFNPARDLSAYETLDVECHLPKLAVATTLTVGIQADKSTKAADAPAVTLNPGWNKIHLNLSDPWLTKAARRSAKQLNFMFTIDAGAPVTRMALANLKLQSKTAPPITDPWSAPLAWHLWNESAAMIFSSEHMTHGEHALGISFDPAQSPAAILYAPLDPALDLSKISAIQCDLFAPATPGELRLVLVHNHLAYPAPPVPLKAGANAISIPLDTTWLPADARSSIHQLRLQIIPSGTKPVTYTLDHLRTR